MPTIEDITAVEGQYLAQPGEPALGTAYDLWLARWRSGLRDRETALRLMFLAWYSIVEPKFLTGLSSATSRTDFVNAFNFMGGEESTDAELCYTVAAMVELFPWSLGDEERWSALGKQLRLRGLALEPSGLAPSQFAGRGAYGAYFMQLLSHVEGDA